MLNSAWSYAKGFFRSNPEKYTEVSAQTFDEWAPTLEDWMSNESFASAVKEFDKMKPYCEQYCSPEVYAELEEKWWAHLRPPPPAIIEVANDMPVIEPTFLEAATNWVKENPVVTGLAILGTASLTGLALFLGRRDAQQSASGTPTSGDEGMNLSKIDPSALPVQRVVPIAQDKDQKEDSGHGNTSAVTHPCALSIRVESTPTLVDANIQQVMDWTRKYLLNRGKSATASDIATDLGVSAQIAEQLVLIREERGVVNLHMKNPILLDRSKSNLDYQNQFIAVFGDALMQRVEDKVKLQPELLENLKDCTIGERSRNLRATARRV